MNFETILVERNEAVGVVTFNRPASMNAICAATLSELTEAFNQFEADETIRVIVIQGAGGAFAAGTDVTDFKNDADGRICAKAADVLKKIKKPVVVAVDGFAFGAGFEIALMGDVVIAADNARFGFPEITIGILPQMGGVGLLVNRIGRAKACDLLMTARHLSADEALADGIVSRVVDTAELGEATMDVAQRMAQMPLTGLKLIKQAVENACINPAADEQGIARLSLCSADAQEGLTALAEKRAPNFAHK